MKKSSFSTFITLLRNYLFIILIILIETNPIIVTKFWCKIGNKSNKTQKKEQCVDFTYIIMKLIHMWEGCGWWIMYPSNLALISTLR